MDGPIDFFVSFNQADRGWAEWIRSVLDRAGYQVAVQTHDFRPGENFILKMDDVARRSRHTLAVLSPDYLSATWPRLEWGAAMARDPAGSQRALIPVRVRPCEPIGLLRAHVYVDLVGIESEPAARRRLLDGVSTRGAALPQGDTPPFPGVAATPRFPGSSRPAASEPAAVGDAPLPDIQIGSRVAGKYLVEERLGEGGMGTVYKAKDLTLYRPVVLKFPHPRLVAEHPVLDALFRREGRAGARLQHAAIVPVFDMKFEGELPFLVMPYLTGGNLRERLASSGGRVRPTNQLPWLRRIAGALDALHDHRIAHCDVKPENILFDQNGDAFLSDFGLATPFGGASTALRLPQHDAGGGGGTPDYMSPEQVESALGAEEGVPKAGQSLVTGRADQYALASLVYEGLTGRPPYIASSLRQLLEAKCQRDPPGLEDVRPRLVRESLAVAAVLRRALSRSPADRFPSCSAFVSAFESEARRARRLPAMVLLLVALLAAAAVGCVVALEDGLLPAAALLLTGGAALLPFLRRA